MRHTKIMSMPSEYNLEWWNIYRAQSDGVHLTIERIDGKSIEADWDTIQKIKDEMLGESVYAVEIYPANDSIVNEINRRHLWVVDPEVIRQLDLSRRGQGDIMEIWKPVEVKEGDDDGINTILFTEGR